MAKDPVINVLMFAISGAAGMLGAEYDSRHKSRLGLACALLAIGAGLIGSAWLDL